MIPTARYQTSTRHVLFIFVWWWSGTAVSAPGKSACPILLVSVYTHLFLASGCAYNPFSFWGPTCVLDSGRKSPENFALKAAP